MSDIDLRIVVLMASGCPKCSFPLDRQRRSLPQRLLFRRLFVCRACGTQLRAWRIPLEGTVRFVASPHTRCISCGNARVRHLATRDRIDHMSAHPFSLIAALVRAPIYHCNACRYQYHDWRGVNPETQERRVGPDASSSPAEKDAAARDSMSGSTEIDDEMDTFSMASAPPAEVASVAASNGRSDALV